MLIKRVYHTPPFESNHRCQFGQFFVQKIQHSWIFLIFTDALEQGTSLCNDLAILLQSLAVVWLHLAKPAIKEPPSLFWRTINQAQIVRGEQYNSHLPNEIDSSFRDAIDFYALTLPVIRRDKLKLPFG